MGREVCCDGEFVYKYVFALQDSEQGRIAEEYDIGVLEVQGKERDILTLRREDIPALKDILESREYLALKEKFESLPSNHPGDTSKGAVSGSPLDRAQFTFQGTTNYFFLVMVAAYVLFMEQRPEKEVFVFEGEC